MDDEWEEEEQLVVVELSGIINTDFLTKSCGTCKILVLMIRCLMGWDTIPQFCGFLHKTEAPDIDSEKPMMQVGQYVFAGEYEDTVGTCVLFEEGPQKGRADSAPELKYTCHTTKKLMMQRIFLTEKREGETSTGSADGHDKAETTCKTHPSLQEGAD